MNLPPTVRRIVLLSLVALSVSNAVAQVTPSQALTTDNVGSSLTPERKKALEDTARLIAESASNALNTPVARRVSEVGAQMARRADDIADATLSQDREKVLKFLGIDPNEEKNLYYFVSFEMPIEVLRAYVVEAMWAGGTLIFRGPPPGRDLGKFMTEDLRSLIYGKGASASISLDPRLFDGYKITTVPTIVYTEDRKNFMCMGVNPKSFQHEGQTLSYDTCPPVDESKYWKISGAVTTDFALREFINAGAKGAQINLDALAKGFATGTVAPRNQQPFTGDWQDVITPDEKRAAESAIETAKQMGTKVKGALEQPAK